MKDLDDMLNNTDFSHESTNREAIKASLLLNFNEKQNYPKGKIIMKKNHFKLALTAAVIVVLTFGISIVAYGDNMINIIKQFMVGEHAKFTVAEHRNSTRPIPDGLKGQLFDADGNELVEFPDDEKEIYNNLGESATIICTENDDGSSFKIATYDELDKERSKSEENMYTYFDTIDDVKPYLAFDPLMPSLLPEGFSVDRIGLFNNKDGSPEPLGSNKYLSVYFTNADKSQEIYMQFRLMDDETGFEGSASKDIRPITVNGNQGVIDGKNADIEINGVMYMIMAGSCNDVTQDDVLKMAESLK